MKKYPNIFKQDLKVNEEDIKRTISKSMTKSVINFAKDVSRNLPESLKGVYEDIQEEK